MSSLEPDRPPAMLFMGDLVVVARQERLVSEARDRGLAPLLVVTPHTDPLRIAARRSDVDSALSQLQEVIWVEDARVETVLPAVQTLLRHYDVRGVMSCGEVFVEPAGVLADCLGLPGAGSTASRICRNKLLQRTAVPALSPPWQVVTPADRDAVSTARLDFPVVVKPVGRFYSLGVRQVDDADELRGVLAMYPADETILLESRVVGEEFSVEALVQGGTILWTGVTGKETNESGSVFFCEMGHTSPAEIPDRDRQALLDANAEVLHRVGFRDGITHAEFRLASGAPVLMEVAARMPGDAITFLWELATGSPLEPVMLDLALGRPTAYPLPRRRASQVFLDHPFGRLRDVASGTAPVCWVERDDRWPRFAPLPPEHASRNHAVLVGRLPGDRLGPQTDSSQRSVSVVYDAPLDEPVATPLMTYLDAVTLTVDAS
jgi:hypothetical protein